MSGKSASIAESLRVPQVRILKALAKANRPMSKSEIAKKAKVSPSMTGNLGPSDPEDIPTSDEQYGKQSLFSLGLVHPGNHLDDDGKNVILWKITSKGIKVCEKLS